MPDIKLEQSLWDKGYVYVAGLDEVGRGPLAGPVVAGCVVITKPEQVVEGVRDSKKISKRKREEYSKQIMDESTGYGVGVVDNDEIDRIGMGAAVNLAMKRALNELSKAFKIFPDYLIIDGQNIRIIEGVESLRMNKGDMLHYSISAASIIAKVARDQMMYKYAEEFPMYGFENHVGYGTKYHMDAITRYGICRIHRKSFSPISKFVVN